jgi:rhomboid family GlyGly-CTERM serine protease
VAGGVFLTQPAAGGRAWLAVAAAGLAGSLLAWWLPANLLDWQPELAGREPWRAVTAAWVHWSPRHLAANLAGAAVLATLGWVARLPGRAALAWALAWPLTQLGLLLRPELAHYGGLSGVLHAGVAVAAVWLVLAAAESRQRFIGAAIVAGLATKLLLEAPWGATLQTSAEWDIAIAPLAHASGAVAGTACAALAALATRRQTMPG